MLSHKLIDWVRTQSNKLDHHFPVESRREALFGRVTKLTEEVGELAEAVLSSEKLQRHEKLADQSPAADQVGRMCRRHHHRAPNRYFVRYRHRPSDHHQNRKDQHPI